MFPKFLPACLAAALLAFAFDPVEPRAATVTDCGGITYSLSPASAGHCGSGNDTNTITATYEMFDETGWKLASKTDEAGGDGKITFIDKPLNKETPPTWGITSPSGIASMVALVLKQGSDFAAFLLIPGQNSGNWSTLKIQNGDLNGLSHASIYYLPGTAAVPLPAPAALLAGALAALGLLRRRARRATAG